MAKLFNDIHFIAKAAGMVYCRHPSGNYFRRRPIVTKKSASGRQQATRQRFKMASAFLSPMRPLIYTGFAAAVYGKTVAMAKAISCLIKEAIIGDYPDLEIRPEKVVLSRGSLPGIDDVSCRLEGGWLCAEWMFREHPFYAADDVVLLVIYQESEPIVILARGKRTDGQVRADVSALSAGSKLLVYLCLHSRDKARYSNSRFLGEFVLDEG